MINKVDIKAEHTTSTNGISKLCVKTVSIPRSRRRHGSESVESTARDRGPSAESARERSHSEALPVRPDAERYAHRVGDLTLPIGDVAVGIGSHSLAGESPKRSIFAPRGAFGCGGAMFTGGRNRDPMPSGTPTPFPHTMRGRPDHRSASAMPVKRYHRRAAGRNV